VRLRGERLHCGHLVWSGAILVPQEVPEHRVAVLGQQGLGMKLDAFDGDLAMP